MKSKKSIHPIFFVLGGILLFLSIFVILPELRILRFFHLMSLEIEEGDVTLLFQGLKHPKKKVVKNAMELAENCFPNDESFSVILEHLRDPHPPSRLVAIRLLATYEEEGREGVPHLIEHLQEDEALFQYNILLTLEQLGPVAEIAVPKLIPFLTHETFEFRKKTAEVLIAIGVKAGIALPQLILCEEAFPKNRYIFEKALTLVGPAQEEVLPDFLEMLEEFSEEEAIQQKILRQLVRMGSNGKSSIPVVLPFLKKESNVLRCLALEALGAFGEKSETVQEQILEQLLEKSGDVRKQASLALRNIGSPTQIPFLEQLLQKEPEASMKTHLQETIEILKQSQ